METLSPSNITFALGIIGIIFTVYLYFKNPQEALEKKQAIDQISVDNKAVILATDLAAEKYSTERRFTERDTQFNKAITEMGQRMDTALTLAQNHTHSVDVKVDKLTENVNMLSLEVRGLSVIIEERVPRRVHPDILNG